MSNKSESLLAFVLGGLVGAALAILYAPQSGKDTRKQLKRLGEDIADSVEDISDDVKVTGRRLYEDGREKLISAKEKLSKSFDKEISKIDEKLDI